MESRPPMEWVAGVDEAGRGPLAGPVIAAAVILHPNQQIEGLADSKVLTERKRESLFGEIKDKAVSWAIGRVDVEIIDQINILQASLLAMKQAVEALSVTAKLALVDGNQCPDLSCAVEAIVKGDKTVPCIGAASILAKVTRDAEMVQMDDLYPGYGFAVHKGYPTKQHLLALENLGPTVIHRQSYAPVKKLLEKQAVQA